MSITLGAALPVGTIVHSMLSTTQFASEYGANWVLADGRSVTGSKYEQITGISSIPDMRGLFLRGKGATFNPDGDLALGTFTDDKLRSHTHGAGAIDNGGTGIFQSGGGGSRNQTLLTDATGGNETAPKSITVNIFIRIN